VTYSGQQFWRSEGTSFPRRVLRLVLAILYCLKKFELITFNRFGCQLLVRGLSCRLDLITTSGWCGHSQ